MPPQEVGVRAFFDTSNFSAGVAAYTRGLKRAIDRTNDAVTAFDNLGAAFSAAFGNNAPAVQAVTAALQQMAQSANRAARNSQRAQQAATPSPTASVDRELEINKLLTEELKDRVQLVRLNQQANTATATQLQRELALLEAETIALRQQKREIQLRDLGALGRLQALNPVAPQQADSPSRLGITEHLQRELELNRLVQAELRDRVALHRAIDRAQDASLTDIQREAAAQERVNLLLQQQRRLAEFTRLGGNPAALLAINRLTVDALDLGKKTTDAIQRQVEWQRILAQEVAATVEVKRVQNILSDRHATILQREAALARLQTLELERQQRSRRVAELGLPQAQLDRIRSATVTMRDLGNAMQRAGQQARGLTTATVALGTALGMIATNALGAMARGVRTMGTGVLDAVQFFERMNLSIAFFTARSMGAETAALNYSQKIALAAEETEGLMQWLTQIAISSPFTTRDVATLFRTSQAYGLLREEAEVLTPLLVDFASAAGLDRDILERLALAIGQVRSRGKLTGEEIRQLGNSGLPIRDILVKTLGIANEEFDELIETGAITSNIAIPAIIKALKEFEGAGEAVALGTIGGLVSALEDLREVATARFFTQALEPLKESFQEFFAVANSPRVLATIQVLGTEVGKHLANAFASLRANVRGAIDAWNELDPATVQQIVVFVGAAVAILAVVAAFGLMVAAINLLMNPVVALTLAGAFLVSEFTSGWRVMTSATRAAVDFIGGAIDALSQMAIGMVRSWGEGFAESAAIVAEFAATVTEWLTFFFAPGSPPRVAPDIDKWGKATGQEYLDAFAEANPETPINKLGQVVERALVDNTIKVTKASVEMLQRGQENATVNMARILNNATRKSYGVIVETTKDVLGGSEAQAAAEEAGIRVSEAYINGFGHLIRKLQPIIDPELQEALFALGSGEHLSAAGAYAFTTFLTGFKGADFGILEEVSSVVENFMQGMVERGELTEGDMLVQLFGTRQDIAAAIQEFRRLGRISEETMDRVVRSSWDAGNQVRDLLVAYQNFAVADDILTAAQKQLNEVTKAYTKTLKPLRAELERISALRQTSDEEQEIASLRRLIANEAVSEFRKENARLKIAEILQGRKVRGIEAEQKAQTDLLQEQVDSASERQQAAQIELDLVKARIQAQTQQLELVNQEAQMMEKLRKEIEKLREKQKSPLDLQSELLKLQQAELADLTKAAKAKYTLDQADSSEMERQQAILDLMEVSLGRQQRLVEARELGIPEEELTKLYNFEVTLDDIGIKTKKDFGDLGGSLDEVIGKTVDAKEESRKWREELAKAKAQIELAKIRLQEMFTVINDNLPNFLKIFPEEEGGKAPIVKTLEEYGWAIAWVGAIIISSKIIQGLTTLVGLLRAIAGTRIALGLASLASTAISRVGPAAEGSVVGIDALIKSLGYLTVGYYAATLAAQGLGAIFKGLNIQQEIAASGPFGEAAQLEVNSLANELGRRAGVGNQFAAPLIGKALRDTFTAGIQAGLTNERIVNSMQESMNALIKQGIVADTEENRLLIEQSMANLLGVLNAQRPGGQPMQVDVVPELKVGELAATDLAPYQSQVESIVKEATDLAIAQGLSTADVATQVTSAINTGISQGLLPDKVELRLAASTYFAELIAAYREAGKIESPSKLSSAELGVPFGQGILFGALSVFTSRNGVNLLINAALANLKKRFRDAFTAIETHATQSADSTRVEVTQDFEEMSSKWKLSSLLLQTALRTRYLGIKTDLTEQSALANSAVTTAFTEMKQAALDQTQLMRDGVMAVFAGSEGEPGLVQQIEFTLLGRDGLRSFNIGSNFIKLMASGITSQQQTLADAMTNAFTYSLAQAQAAIPPTGTPGGGVVGGVQARVDSRPSAIYPAGTNIVNNNRYYYLTVQTSQTSQGVISDFGIMQTLAPD